MTRQSVGTSKTDGMWLMEEISLNKKINILIVEDNDLCAKAWEAMIAQGFEQSSIVLATSLADAVRWVGVKRFDIVLLDLTLPDCQGLDTLISLHAQTKAPIVVLTGQDDETVASDALKCGAADYLVKGEVNHRQLTRSIKYAIERNFSIQLSAEKIRLFEQREDFMATLTHDLKNPLIGANRIFDLMVDGTLGELPQKHVELLLSLKDSNDALLAMIRNLLEVYRFEKDLDKIQRENTDLKMLVDNYLDSVAPLLKDKQIELSVSCQNIGDIPAEHNSIVRVIQNLIENAIKFTPKGGLISIKLWSDQANVFFQIADSGPGVPEQERKRLFQRFFQGTRGKASQVGTGLGLYLCRQIVEAHEGRIWCEKYDEKRGAIFTLSLPAALISA